MPTLQKCWFCFIIRPHTFITVKPYAKPNLSESELTTHLNTWLFYSKNLKDLQMIPQVFQGNGVFKQAFKTAHIAKMNREERQSYEYSN
ncbi:PD-(D/E)XK nuclease family transposase [Moraxella boevrei]|uniref:PD-(D/E)XK nuclease family transposase n=1 Tax=Faucicola boevrei TaxID=346665 RepID=UPI0003814AE6|nr:PD-(D/E)XK nuclease family transposase [Moraxella boevrei]